MSIYLTNEEKKKLEQTNECYMIGILADEEKEEFEFEQFMLMNNSDSISFYIKSISDIPIPIKKIDERLEYKEFYSGIDKHIVSSTIGMPISYKYNTDYSEKIKILKEKLQNKLIVFKPTINIKKPKYANGYDFLNEDEYLVYKNLDIVSTEEMPELEIDEVNFIPVPYVKYNYSDFDEMLYDGQHIVFAEYTDKYLPPEYVLCNEYLYFDFKNWIPHENNGKSWRCTDKKGDWKRIKLSNEDIYNLKNFIRASDNLLFINENFAREIVDNYEQIDDEQNEDLNSEVEINKIIDIISGENISEENDESCNKEQLFINALKEYTLGRGLSYSNKNLVNFHICVKTNLITILTGMTGTGKSELARAYAKMLDLSSENENLLFMPISPNYNEPSDVIGYMNTISGIYNSSETGLLDFIIKANENPDKIFMVIFDEMNLSQVEHWFAPFISLLEVEEQERFLPLYSYKTKCLNDSQYPHKVRVGSNIRFVGTMNIDETTRDISDRLLDRANAITLDKIKFRDLIKDMDEFDLSRSSYEKHICRKYDDYNKWIQRERPLNEFSTSEIDFFDKLHEMIVSYDFQKGVSFRVLQRIGVYIKNIPVDSNCDEMISRQEAVDLQVKQRIITKLKGTAKQFEALIGIYEFDTNDVVNSKLLDLLESEDSQIISDFRETKKEIQRKAQELATYGYTN